MMNKHSNKSRKAISIIVSILCYASLEAQQKTILLYNGPAPGSESWDWDEKIFFVKTPLNANVAYNISKPSLTVFTPDSANGTAVIIFPGGNFHVLSIENDGSSIAKALNKSGITAFLLKYRLVHTVTDDPWKEMRTSMKDSAAFTKKIATAREFAIADAKKAVEYVRQHAVEYNINSRRIGVIGCSGGGTLAINLSLNEKEELRPNFGGFIYSVFRPEYNLVPLNAPPAFIACATDDTLAPVTNSIKLYNAWKTANIPVELHIYSKGEHGLRTSEAARNWILRFQEWLGTPGLLERKQ